MQAGKDGKIRKKPQKNAVLHRRELSGLLRDIGKRRFETGQSLLSVGAIDDHIDANFAGIDQAAQQQQVGNLNAAMGMQGQGANTLGMIGQAQQAQNQAQGDADYTALAQRIGLFSGVAPKEQNTTSTGGK